MKNCLMVSIVFFDSEQLLTYNQPSKNASKYPKLACAKIAILHSTDFGGLIRPLNHIFLGLSMFGAHPQGLEGIYIQVSLWVVGEVFLEKCKKPEMKLGLTTSIDQINPHCNITSSGLMILFKVKYVIHFSFQN